MLPLRTLPLFFCMLFSQIIDCQSLKLDLDNSLSVRNFQYLNRANDISNMTELRTDSDLQLKYKTNLTAKLSARGIYNYTNRPRSRLFLNEAYIALSKGKVHSKFGKQIIKYGKLTGISNLDLANTYDYFDFLITDEEELGQWGLTSKLDLKQVQVEFSYVNNVNPSIIYFTDNPWTRLPSELNHPTQEGVMIPLRFRDIVRVGSEARKRAFDLGLSIDLQGLTARLDVYQGYNDIPFRRLNLDASMQSIPVAYDLELSQEALNIYNLNVQKLVGDWNLWFEFGLIKNKYSNEDGSIDSDDYSLFSLGVDRLILFDDPTKLLKLVGQWRHAIWNNNIVYHATDLDHVLDRCFIFDIDYQHSYKLNFGLRSVVSYDSFGVYLSPSFNYKISNNISLSAGYDLLSGSDSQFFGHYSYNDRFILNLKLEI